MERIKKTNVLGPWSVGSVQKVRMGLLSLSKCMSGDEDIGKEVTKSGSRINAGRK